MRFLNKYKLHENFASGSKKLPLRVLKFKRPKWANIKRKLKDRNVFWKFGKKRFKKRPHFINLLKVRLQKKFYFNKVFSKKFQTRKYISSLYDNSIKFSNDKKHTFRKTLISSILVKPLFRIDILLWYLKFFVSSWSARQFISSGHVYINSKRIKLNYIIKKGDVITFDLPESIESINAYVEIKSKFLKSRNFLPFLEYDYYTNTFIVLKNWNEVSENDLALLFNDNKKVKYVMYK